MALTNDDPRALALALPGAVEQDHHGSPSFRVGGKIFATLDQADRALLAELLEDAWKGKGGTRGL
jgi:hypothetical protein